MHALRRRMQHGCMNCSTARLHGLQRRLRRRCTEHSMAAWTAAQIAAPPRETAARCTSAARCTDWITAWPHGTQHCCMDCSTTHGLGGSTAAWSMACNVGHSTPAWTAAWVGSQLGCVDCSTAASFAAHRMRQLRARLHELRRKSERIRMRRSTAARVAAQWVGCSTLHGTEHSAAAWAAGRCRTPNTAGCVGPRTAAWIAAQMGARPPGCSALRGSQHGCMGCSTLHGSDHRAQRSCTGGSTEESAPHGTQPAPRLAAQAAAHCTDQITARCMRCSVLHGAPRGTQGAARCMV